MDTLIRLLQQLLKDFGGAIEKLILQALKAIEKGALDALHSLLEELDRKIPNINLSSALRS